MLLLFQKISDAWKVRIGSLLILSFFASIASFLRLFPFGYDSYASIVCQTGSDCSRLGLQPLMVALLGVVPYSPLVLNFIFWSVTFFVFLALFLIGLHFVKDERVVWIALLVLVSFCPFFVFHLHEWENELFAYPLLLFGLWFVLKKKWFPAIMLFVLGCLFWGGSVYILAVWGLMVVEGWMLLPFVGAFFVVKDSLFGFLTPTNVSESILGAGLLDLFLLVFVLPFSLYYSEDGGLFFGLALAAGLGMVILQGKLVFVLVPFALLGLTRLIELLEKQQDSVVILNKN